MIKTGKEHNLHPELKVKTSDTCEEIRKAMGKNHHSDYWSTVVRLANGLEIVLPLTDKKFGMAANSVEKATSLLLSLNDADLEVYREKVGLTIEEMKFSLKLLKHKAIKVIDANRPLHDDKSLYLLDIFDISAMSEYEMRKIQLLMDTHRGPEYQIEQMELNVAAHKQYMSELYRLMYHANEMPLEKRLDSLFLLITHANNFSNDQMVHFHIGLGEGLIGEFEAPVDRDSWQTLLRLFEHAKVAVETSQDVTELAGVSFNLRYLGEEPSDAGERVDIFLEHQHDAFFVIPLELWNGK